MGHEKKRKALYVAGIAAILSAIIFVVVASHSFHASVDPADKWSFTELASGENYRILRHDLTGVAYAVSEDGTFTPLLHVSGRPIYADPG